MQCIVKCNCTDALQSDAILDKEFCTDKCISEHSERQENCIQNCKILRAQAKELHRKHLLKESNSSESLKSNTSATSHVNLIEVSWIQSPNKSDNQSSTLNYLGYCVLMLILVLATY